MLGCRRLVPTVRFSGAVVGSPGWEDPLSVSEETDKGFVGNIAKDPRATTPGADGRRGSMPEVGSSSLL